MKTCDIAITIVQGVISSRCSFWILEIKMLYMSTPLFDRILFLRQVNFHHQIKAFLCQYMNPGIDPCYKAIDLDFKRMVNWGLQELIATHSWPREALMLQSDGIVVECFTLLSIHLLAVTVGNISPGKVVVMTWHQVTELPSALLTLCEAGLSVAGYLENVAEQTIEFDSYLISHNAHVT